MFDPDDDVQPEPEPKPKRSARTRKPKPEPEPKPKRSARTRKPKPAPEQKAPRSQSPLARRGTTALARPRWTVVQSPRERSVEAIDAEIDDTPRSRIALALPAERSRIALALPAETESARLEREDRESAAEIMAAWRRRVPGLPDWTADIEVPDRSAPKAARTAARKLASAELRRRLKELRSWIGVSRRQRAALLKDVRDLCRVERGRVRERAATTRAAARTEIDELRAILRERVSAIRARTKVLIGQMRTRQRAVCARDLERARRVATEEIDRAIEEYRAGRASYADTMALFGGRRSKTISAAERAERQRARPQSRPRRAGDAEILDELERRADYESDPHWSDAAMAWRLMSERERARFRASKNRSRLESVLEFFENRANAVEIVSRGMEAAIDAEIAIAEREELAYREELAARAAAGSPSAQARAAELEIEIPEELAGQTFDLEIPF